VIDVSAYGEEPEVEFQLPASPQPTPQKPVPPALEYAWREPTFIVRTPSRTKRKPRRPWLLTTGAFVIGMAGCAIGIPLCLTVVFAPVGIPLMMASCLPLHLLLERHAKKVTAWYERDRPLDEDTVKPWNL